MSAFSDNKAIIFYKDWERYFKHFSDEDKGRLLTAIYDYARLGQLTKFHEKGLTVALEVFVAAIDRDNEKWVKKCEARASAGRASAEKRRKEKEKQKKSSAANDGFVKQKSTKGTNVNFVQQNSTKATDKDKDKDKEREKDKDKNKKEVSLCETNTPPPDNNPKSYGEYMHVLLSGEQHQKLLNDFGKEKTADYIRRVDEYCQQTGKEYKDHYLTIRKWIRADETKIRKAADSPNGENSSLDVDKAVQRINDRWKKKEIAPNAANIESNSFK